MGSILLGLVPALGWGFQGIILQKVGGNSANKQMGMVLTNLVFGIVVLLVHPIAWSGDLVAAAAVNGIPWAVAQILQIKSFDYLGVSRAMPLTAGMQLVMSTAVGAIWLGEWSHAWQFACGIAALVLIIVGTAMTAYQEHPDNEAEATSAPGDIRKGVIITFISAALFVAYASAANVFKVEALDLLFPQSVFMFVSTVIIACVMCGKLAPKGMGDPVEGVFGKKSWLNMSAGVLWSIANIAVLFSNQLNGVAVGWTLANMNLIFATLGGLFILHERKTPKELRFVVLGMVLVAVGGVLVGITKLA